LESFVFFENNKAFKIFENKLFKRLICFENFVKV